MGMNETPSSDRIHIGFFGRRNAGKSSLVNAVTGQELAVVSEIKGTTTDPVSKSMELLPLGPVVIIDTPGIDDEGRLGGLRVRKARQVLNRTDVAVLVVDGTTGRTEADEELISIFREKEIPYLVVYNKSDLTAGPLTELSEEEIWVSAREGWQIQELKERIGRLTVTGEPKRRLVGDLLAPGDFVVLVVPIDKAAPKGRLILPQQQVIRDVLEAGAAAIVVRDHELKATPGDIWLTSFSILFARYKGNLRSAAAGAATLDRLCDGDKILISEGCTHHRQCDDIGTVKLPGWIRKYTGKELNFEFTSGLEFPENLSGYRLIIHCGGCMLNEREMKYRIKCAADQKAPMTNYGIAIAYIQGILRRCVEMFPDVRAELSEKP